MSYYFTFVITAILLLPIFGVIAQEQMICPDVPEPAATTTRTVRLERLGVQITIPENFRAVLQQEGQVVILDPNTFAQLECQAMGGIVYGHGHFSQQLQVIPRDPALSFREQALWSVGYSLTETGEKTTVASVIHSHRWHGLPAYIVESEFGYGIVMMVLWPGEQRVLEMSVSCDCEVNMDDLLNFANSIEPLRECELARQPDSHTARLQPVI